MHGENISMANISLCTAVGIGSIQLRTTDGQIFTLNDVRHVSQMSKILISLVLLIVRASISEVKVEFCMSTMVLMWF